MYELTEPTPEPQRSTQRDRAIAAAVLAGVFTIVGAIAGVCLDHAIQRRTLKDVWRKDVAALVVQRSNGRLVRARAVLMAAGSSVFERRWDDYIERGVTQWNEDYSLVRYGIDHYFPKAAPDFARLQDSFQRLHSVLLVYHRQGGQVSAATEEAANLEARRVEDIVGALTAEVLDAR
jgi:hypothetical protein